MIPDNNCIVVAATGDIMLGDGLHMINRGVRAKWSKAHPSLLPLSAAKAFEDADICLGNLECMLGKVDSQNPLNMIYKGDPTHLSLFRQWGFTHFTLANNHILEQGLMVAEETKTWVQNSGIAACCHPNPTRHFVAGTAVDIFTYNLIQDTPSHSFYRDRIDTEDLKQIKQSDVPIKIVSIHWGEEFSQYPSPRQIELAHQFVDCGVNIVLGHHPHVIQGIEKYRGSLIAYSLGNFIFDMPWSEETQSGFILKTTIAGGKVVVAEKIPYRLDANFLPHLQRGCCATSKIDMQVLRFQGQPEAYLAYHKRRLRLSRLRALAHLLVNGFKVSPFTWRAIAHKRLKRLGLA